MPSRPTIRIPPTSTTSSSPRWRYTTSPRRRNASYSTALTEALVPGGWFVNGDVIRFDAPHLETLSSEMIKNWVRSKGWEEDEFMNRWQASDEHDDPDTLTDQLLWLRESGFESVTSIWQYYNFAVYGARKPE